MEWVRQGAEDEDATAGPEGFIRYNSHFYNPLTRQGLADPSVFNPAKAHAEPALNWAWNNQGASDLNPDYSWMEARRQFWIWFTAAEADEREEGAARTFYSLGHVLHVLQDMAVPQHTRNDAHPPWEAGVAGAPFETFCLRAYGAVEAVAQLGEEKIPRFSAMTNAVLSEGIPPQFAAFWDTGQLRAKAAATNSVGALWSGTPGLVEFSNAGLWSGTPGLAEFSNAHFVTDDTMFTMEPQWQAFVNLEDGRSHPLRAAVVPSSHQFPFPRLAELGRGLLEMIPSTNGASSLLNSRRPVTALSRAGEKPVHGLSPEQFFADGVTCGLGSLVPDLCSVKLETVNWPTLGDVHTLHVGLREVNYAAHARTLIPKAVAYSTGLLNYFFRGRLDARLLPGMGNKGGDLLEITNLSEESLFDGEFAILCDEHDATRRESRVRISNENGYPGCLEPGASFTVDVGELRLGATNWLVFRGTLGEEEDIAVVAQRWCCVESLPSDQPAYRAIDLGDFPGRFDLEKANWGLGHSGEVLGFHRALISDPLGGDPLNVQGGGGFVWSDRNGDGAAQSEEMRSVGRGQGFATRVMDINDAGVVAGTVYDAEGRQWLARWLPSIHGGTYADPEVKRSETVGALEINNAGTILDPFTGWLWFRQGALEDLRASFEAELDTNVYAFDLALSLNDRHDLLIRARSDPEGEPTPVYLVWRPGEDPVELPMKAGAVAVLNNQGRVLLMTFKTVVMGEFEVELPSLAVHDVPSGTTWNLHVMWDTMDLNDCGVAVGSQTVGSETIPQIWDPLNGLRNLTALVEMPPGTVLESPLRINNAGEILVKGRVGAVPHVFLLVPVREETGGPVQGLQRR